MSDNMSWKFHWLTKWDEIWHEDFVSQWQRWLDESPSAHVFYHPALVRAWIETYLPLRDIRPCFLVAEAPGQMVFFPLVLWRRNWKNAFQKLLIPVGYSDYDYHDPLFTENVAQSDKNIFWQEFEQALSTSSPVIYDRLLFDGIRQRSIPYSNIQTKNQRWNKIESCPWIDLSKFKKPEEFLPSLKTSLRQDLRRQQRRMAEIGVIEFKSYGTGKEREALQEVPDFLAFHSCRWPGAYKAPGFFKYLFEYGMEANILRFPVLRLNSKTIAWHLVFQFQDKIYSYMPAHNKEFEKLSPGKVLLLRIIEDAIAQGLECYDFLRGEESYKVGWTDKTETLWSFQMDGGRLSSRLKNVAVDKLKTRLKKVLNQGNIYAAD